jgi:hypothetical protein
MGATQRADSMAFKIETGIPVSLWQAEQTCK